MWQSFLAVLRSLRATLLESLQPKPSKPLEFCSRIVLVGPPPYSLSSQRLDRVSRIRMRLNDEPHPPLVTSRKKCEVGDSLP